MIDCRAERIHVLRWHGFSVLAMCHSIPFLMVRLVFGIKFNAHIDTRLVRIHIYVRLVQHQMSSNLNFQILVFSLKLF